ncbi:MAG: choice-of-anchor B family protein [Chitinophagales bacterium]|nr:choice-of-anchor B family protein [Chitinophagales bacterium]MDW8419748.1 choice-of-anchor B family protein [Chitinophagales bacterium]
MQVLGHYTFPAGVTCSNLTGYVDSTGREYALVGTSQGLSIIDISNPSNPVQKFFVPGATGPGGFWREVREYKGFAYVTTEEKSGLVVVDLRELPDSIKSHQINPAGMLTSHTIFIDEKGVAYVNGTDKGLLFLNCAANGWNPPLLGKFDVFYVHDCYARNDTLWAACINDGFILVLNVTNKTQANNPNNVLAMWNTPQEFSHNCWLSDDGKYLFTTDEKPGSYLTCYDVSNLQNVTETDRNKAEPDSNTIIHNTHFINNYCVSSYYTYGVTIHDVTRKNNLVLVGHFDTSPDYSGEGFHGAWGVWPYLPSGNIIVSDIETGLWILKPTYKRACYLEGIVRDTICNTGLNNVKVEIVEDTVHDYTNFQGRFNLGTPDSGTYTIRFSKNGYQTKTIPNVTLKNGHLVTFNINLQSVATTQLFVRTVDSFDLPLPFIRVLITDSAGNDVEEFATDANATYSSCNIVSGNYTFYAGRWGKVTTKVTKSVAGLTDTLIIKVHNGYYDDFVMDFGWTVAHTTTKGEWEWGEPQGTYYQGITSNPQYDVDDDYGFKCYVTGNNGGQPGDDDVDDGLTILRSPLFNLTGYTYPLIKYRLWFFNGGGSGTTPNDTLWVRLSNGFDTAIVDMRTSSDQMSKWTSASIPVKNYMALTPNMRIEFIAKDTDPGHLVEAGVDYFLVKDTTEPVQSVAENALVDLPKLYVSPNPYDEVCRVHASGAPQGSYVELMDLPGRVVYSHKLSHTNETIMLPGYLASGAYLLRLVNGRQIFCTQRVIRR